MDACQFCQGKQDVKILEGRPICSTCLQSLFAQLLGEEKTKQGRDIEEKKREDAIELINHMIHSHLYTTHFHIEGINIEKWTDEKIEESLKWILVKLS